MTLLLFKWSQKFLGFFWSCLLVCFIHTEGSCYVSSIILSLEGGTVRTFEELRSDLGQKQLLSGACIVPGMGPAWEFTVLVIR